MTTTHEPDSHQAALTEAQVWALRQVKDRADWAFRELRKAKNEAQGGMERMLRDQTPSYTMSHDVVPGHGVTEASARLQQALDTCAALRIAPGMVQAAYRDGVQEASRGL